MGVLSTLIAFEKNKEILNTKKIFKKILKENQPNKYLYKKNLQFLLNMCILL